MLLRYSFEELSIKGAAAMALGMGVCVFGRAGQQFILKVGADKVSISPDEYITPSCSPYYLF